jgi:uncharacterized protein
MRQDVHVAAVVSDELRITDAWVPGDAEVSFEGWVESTIGGMTLAGTVVATFEGVCRRCLETAVGTVTAEVRELCRDDADPDDGYRAGPETLDLEPIVHDACILELPLAPLCSPQCRGLCPDCGVNRNRETCSCGQPTDLRWAGLAGLEPEQEAE